VVSAGVAELPWLPEELDSEAEPDSLDPDEEGPDSTLEDPDPDAEEPDSLAEEPDSVVDEPDSPAEPDPASEPLDPCSLVEGGEDPSVAEDDPSAVLDRGAWAGALSPEAPVEVPLPVRVLVAPVERGASRALVARVSLTVLPGKALAATAVSTPVSVALPAISQRLTRRSRRRAASREREVWLGLTAIDRGAESWCTGGS
jgi:hypothetical protein